MQLGGTEVLEVWAAALAKWTQRVATAADDAAPAVAMAVHYNARTLPVLGYSATMFAPVPDMARLDRDAAMLGPGTVSDRPMARWEAPYDDRQVGVRSQLS